MNKAKRQTRDQKIYYLVSSTGLSQREVARAYKLSQTAVWKIVRSVAAQATEMTTQQFQCASCGRRFRYTADRSDEGLLPCLCMACYRRLTGDTTASEDRS